MTEPGKGSAGRFLRGWYWPLLGPFWILWQVIKNPGAWVTILAIVGVLQIGGIDLAKAYWSRIQESKRTKAELEQTRVKLEQVQAEFKTLADETRLESAVQLSVTRSGLFTWQLEALDRDGRAVGEAVQINAENGLYQWIRRTMMDIRQRAQEDVALSQKGEDSYVLTSLKDIEEGKLRLALKTRFVSFTAPAGWPNAGERRVDLGTWELEIRGAEGLLPVAVDGQWISRKSAELWAKLNTGSDPNQSTVFTPEVDLGSMTRGMRCCYTLQMNRQGAVSPGWLLTSKEQLPGGP